MDGMIGNMDLGVRLYEFRYCYGNLAKLIYVVAHLFIFKLVIMVSLIEPLEELKEIIHMKAAIMMMIMFSSVIPKKCNFLSFSVTELVFTSIPNPSWC